MGDNDKKKVLVVDDSSFLRGSLKKILETAGYQVVDTAANGLEAVSKFKELKPDLVTLDYIMPQMNGLAVLKMLRSVDAEARVVMVSSMSAKESVTECLKEGAKNYILKPVEVIEKALA